MTLEDEYFCPNCNAILNNQLGFDPDCGVWACTECGTILYGDEIDETMLQFDGIVWYCDSCGAVLNKQSGFNDYCGIWCCTECGHANPINEDEIYDSMEEYQRKQHTYECPNCTAELNDQSYFDEDDCWTCEFCGEKLYKDGNQYEVMYGSGNGGSDSHDSSSRSADLDFTATSAKCAVEARERARRKDLKRLERIRIAAEKRRLRLAEKKKNRKQRSKRIKAFLFNKKNLTLEFNTTDLVGSSVDSVVEKIRDAGFNHYRTVAIKDLYVGSNKSVGEVEQILFSGQSYLKKGTMVPYNAEIVITFHVKEEFVLPYSSRHMRRRDFEELTKELSNIGFTEVYPFPLNDLTTGWIKKDRAVQRVLIDGIDSIKKEWLLNTIKRLPFNITHTKNA